MPFSVVMPALEIAQETGKLLAWRKKEGERVSKGEPLVEIETDKAVVELEAPADGILAGIKVTEGADVPVGRTIAWILAPGEVAPTEAEPVAPAARTGSHVRAESAPDSVPPQVLAAGAEISPKARRLAKELGVDIATVRGSGSQGEILAADVQAAAMANPAAVQKQSARIEVPGSLRRIMAERTTQSWTTVPHFFVSRDIDVGALKQYRDRTVAEFERTHQVRITHTDLLVALVARVLRKHPRLNASWTEQGVQLHDHVHMGIAVAVNDGVVAAVIRAAHTAELADIARERGALAERARAGRLRPADISDATFTISNLGMYQVDQFTAIITPPQVAVLAVGGIADRVVVREGKPAVRPAMTLTISCDHRVTDGARAALFLKDLADAMQDPEKFL
jgi:pyruvate dehydrogenase E2 component (dihydrolipoamide acetyltransferase)